MYAIRSYYGSLDVKVTEVMTKTLITVDPDSSLKESARIMSNNKISRITSYNVCYTKLLRFVKPKVAQGFKVD